MHRLPALLSNSPPQSGRPFLPARNHQVECGPAQTILSEDLQQWFRHCLGCVAGRREFVAKRYFAVNAHNLSDIVVGWRRFLGALERREAIACLYVTPNPAEILASSGVVVSGAGFRPAISALAEIMSTLSEKMASTLVEGGALNFVINLQCPVTSRGTQFFDFDAVAFVPEAGNSDDPLYDPLMSAPVPMVNINSDIYAFSMFTREQALSRFECEVPQLTRRERYYIFQEACAAWQRMAEMTIKNYAAKVDQRLCPTHLTDDKRSWVANHRDPAFAELEKRPFLREMPVQYTAKIVSIWENYFENGVRPQYKDIAAPGVDLPSRCPVGVQLCAANP